MPDSASATPMNELVPTTSIAAQPTVYQLCIEDPLYHQRDNIAHLTLARMKRHFAQIDVHCIRCQKETVFSTKYRTVTGGVGAEDKVEGTFPLTLTCKRCGYSYDFFFKYESGYLEKIGQYPAIADITGAELLRYKPLLRDGYFGELMRANGLISHGVGIGSFVYLRRIFEKLIEDHRREFELSNEAIAGFDGLRMEDKIAALKSVLPPALVKNRATYGILSSGIHGLDEATCKLYFPVVKAAIVQILEQDFEARERKRKEAELETEIAKITAALKRS